MLADITRNETIGLIAGDGDLPSEAIRYCSTRAQNLYVVAFEGHDEELPLKDVTHGVFHLGAVGKAITALRAADVSTLVLAGRVGRPSLSSLNMDFSALKLLRRLTKSSFFGDNYVFTTLIEFLEDQGFKVIGVQDVAPELLAEKGVLTKEKPDKRAQNDIEIASHILHTMGDLDVGQGAVVQQGLVLGIEAIEGTDALLQRCGELRKKGDGGVLVKLKKPAQDARIDLPTIGPNTIENAHKAGLRGIALDAGNALIVRKNEVIAKANELGLFIIGV